MILSPTLGLEPLAALEDRGFVVQSAQPRDFAALVLVVGLFAVLLAVTVLVGGPAH